MKYRKVPTEVEAIQYDGENVSEISKMFTGVEYVEGNLIVHVTDNKDAFIKVPVGTWFVMDGDEPMLVDAKTFARSYEAAE